MELNKWLYDTAIQKSIISIDVIFWKNMKTPLYFRINMISVFTSEEINSLCFILVQIFRNEDNGW